MDISHTFQSYQSFFDLYRTKICDVFSSMMSNVTNALTTPPPVDQRSHKNIKKKTNKKRTKTRKIRRKHRNQRRR